MSQRAPSDMAEAALPRQPKLRADLVFADAVERGEPCTYVRDPLSQSFFRLSELSHRIARMLDGTRTPAEIGATLSTELGGNVPEAPIAALVRQLAGHGFLENGPAPPPRRKVRGNALYLIIPLFDPDALLNRFRPLLRTLTSRVSAALLALLAVVGVAFSCRAYLQGGGPALGTLSATDFIALYALALLGVAAHELAHAAVLKRFGGQVHEIGVLLLYFQPCFYCNVSDAYMLPRRQRLLVSAAGAYLELGLLGVAAVIAAVLGPAHAIGRYATFVAAITGVRSVLFNLNPLIKLDGYYLLTDLVQIPNLRQRAFAYLKARLLYTVGRGAKPTVRDQREAAILLVYASLSGAFLVVIFTVLGAQLIHMIRHPELTLGNVILFAFAAFAMLGLLRRLALAVWGTRPSNPRPASKAILRPRTLGITLLALLGLGLSLYLACLHYRVHTDPLYQSWCSLAARVDCAAVERSPDALLFGLPRVLFGVLGYLVLAAIALPWRKTAATTWPLGLLLLLASVFVAESVHSVAVTVKLGQLCVLCAATWAINAGLLVAVIAALRRERCGPIAALEADLKHLAAHPLRSVLALVCVGLCLAALTLFLPRYWLFSLPEPYGPNGLAHGQGPDGHYWIGAQKPVLVIEEYSDFECPFCVLGHARVRAAVAQHPNEVRLVSRHYPLDNACNRRLREPFHTEACLAARAALCAGEQGRYFEMSDTLHAGHARLGSAFIDEVGRKLGLDASAFARCLAAASTAASIDKDIVDGTANGVTGTPSYVVDGVLQRGAFTVDRIGELLAAAHKAASLPPR